MNKNEVPPNISERFTERWVLLHAYQEFLDLYHLQVNGNLVPPLHVLANAEVVEIVTYNVLYIR